MGKTGNLESNTLIISFLQKTDMCEITGMRVFLKVTTSVFFVMICCHFGILEKFIIPLKQI